VTPEELTRQKIDGQFSQLDCVVQNRRAMTISAGAALSQRFIVR
jgi:hypothetical protein